MWNGAGLQKKKCKKKERRGGGGLVGEGHIECVNFGGSSSGSFVCLFVLKKKTATLTHWKNLPFQLFHNWHSTQFEATKTYCTTPKPRKSCIKKLPCHCNSRAVVGNHRLQPHWGENFSQLNFVSSFSFFPSHTVDTRTPEGPGRFGRNQLGVRLTAGSPGEIWGRDESGAADLLIQSEWKRSQRSVRALMAPRRPLFFPQIGTLMRANVWPAWAWHAFHLNAGGVLHIYVFVKKDVHACHALTRWLHHSQ